MAADLLFALIHDREDHKAAILAAQSLALVRACEDQEAAIHGCRFALAIVHDREHQERSS
jgi:hypothetical protein